MKYRKQVLLKNNITCLIRQAGAEDAAEMVRSFNLTHGETDFLLSYPDENSYNECEERTFLMTKEQSADEIELCAVIDGKIIGSSGIEKVGEKYKVKHRAVLGISVEKAYWNLGIGKALMDACIHCARKAGYAQLELEVVSDNKVAIALYEIEGFRKFGRNPLGFRCRNGLYQETILMRLQLS